MAGNEKAAAMSIDPRDNRRQGRVVVAFKDDSKVGTLTVDGEIWGTIEWSEKRGVWCIEDAEGKCLRHASSIHGKAAAKDEAIALAERLVRDGTLPSPEKAKRLRQQVREQRAKRPSEVRRKQERTEHVRLFSTMINAEWEDKKATPFYEIFAEAFDLADPGLWKSNSFAMVRPRLLLEVNAAITRLEYELHEGCTGKSRRWRQHPRYRDWQQALERKVARAREILALLEEPI